MGRRVLRDYRWDGQSIPAGSLILMSQWVMHRDPRWWPDPDALRPRALARGLPRAPRFAYFPFGGGNRLCIGESFAWSEAIVIVAALAQRWRFALDPCTRSKRCR